MIDKFEDKKQPEDHDSVYVHTNMFIYIHTCTNIYKIHTYIHTYLKQCVQ